VELLNRPHGTAWANLGLWHPGADYPRAAAALASLVGDAAGLDTKTNLLDVGVGAGEQLVHWIEYFGVPRVVAVEIDPAMMEEARRRVAAAGLDDRVEVRLDDAAAMYAAPGGSHAGGSGAPRPFDAVVALDCAYHFAPRTSFFAGACAALRPGGRLALTDLVVGETTPHGLSRMARRSGIPVENLVSEAEYRRRLCAAGFADLRTADLTDAVLGGFSRWACARAPELIARGGRAGLMVLGTAAASAAARRAGLRYLLISARSART
jgi:cyclopropane fatty-acyl-phospholipid synthase-like methyltransferase